MKLKIMILTAVFGVAAGAQADIIGTTDTRATVDTVEADIQTENTEGKITAVYVEMCIRHFEQFRATIIADNKRDIRMMESKQAAADRAGDGAWVSALGQTITTTESLNAGLQRTSNKPSQARCENMSAIDGVIRRIPNY
jgi:hypothetical protein